MNINTIIKVGTSVLRNIKLKLLRGSDYHCKWLYSCSPSTEIRIHKGGKLTIGQHLSTLRNVLVSVCPNATLVIGDNVNINTDCSIIAKNKISIGNDVIFGPGCKIYDHDHDYTKTGKERRESFVTGTVKVGNGVWFGANCIVLRGTVIGDNCVFGAGTIIKGDYPDNTLVVQERAEKQKRISFSKEEGSNNDREN